ncbi:MAG TPA: TIM barrel protein [Gemmatimonadaceae bacterium]|nr:TIM barrel protein [Gemmatimonadaceae bacterium]
MCQSVSRREFLERLAGTTAVFAAGAYVVPARAMRWGYASISWDGKDLLAIDEISMLGFPGIQLRSNILPRFVERPQVLRELLAARKLTFVALSSGAVKLDPTIEQAVIDEHVAHARFVHDTGGQFLQVTDERPAGRPVSHEDCERLAHLLTEIGRRTAEIGIPLAYHPHMGSIGERPDDVDRVLAAADARHVKLLLDVAHYQQGGGDPVAAIRRYQDRLAFLHLKDVETIARAAPRSGPPYRFVELGRGHVDLRGILQALHDIEFGGWAVIELDAVPDLGRSPSECALVNKQYLETLGISI